MDVLLLCGYFEAKYQAEIARKTKTWVENAANTFQQRLIHGLLKQNISLRVVSAPFIGPWPTVHADIFFRGFEVGESNEGIRYLPFNNIWGYRNLSRAAALKRAVRSFLHESTDPERAILIYAPHTPFLEAAAYAKRMDPHIHIHLIVPDLPQYMNLSMRAHPIYDCFKRIDIARFYKLNHQVDSYTLLTKHMASVLEVGDRPYIVTEAIMDDIPIQPKKTHPRGKTIAYAGKLTESFGLRRLTQAFEGIPDRDARLDICGGGELRAYIEERAQKDRRIHYHGQVSAQEAQRIILNADVLVNPRLNDCAYTRYSFPSKNIEYLLSGNRVVAYMLDGMPEFYRKLICIPADDSISALRDALVQELNASTGDAGCTEEVFTRLQERLGAAHVAEKICRLLRNQK